MTAHSQKTEQKRLDSCVSTLHKWAKTQQKLRQNARKTFKDDHFATNNAPEVENAQAPLNIKLLRKYRRKTVIYYNFMAVRQGLAPSR